MKAVSAALVVLMANKIMREACRREMAAWRCWRHGGDGEGGMQERGDSCSFPSSLTSQQLNFTSPFHHLPGLLGSGGEAVGGCLTWGTDGGAGGAGGGDGAGDAGSGWTHQ